MKNSVLDKPVANSNKPLRKSKQIWLGFSLILVATLAILSLLTLHIASTLFVAKPNEHSNRTVKTPLQQLAAVTQVAFDPRAGFPGKSTLNILVMGIDDNWTDQNVLYTKNARTDTLFLLNLDLKERTAAMLSVPRDSYVQIAGTDRSDKINSAYATGGPERSEATFANLTGVTPDYYIVLNIDATKRLVDALGGVDVIVEHEMNYDDNWGHLHVHLHPGLQHMDGERALEFVRYRHGNRGLAPEDGDPRRIYRQHVLLRAMLSKSKTFGAAFHTTDLVNIAMSCISTNLSRTQLGDLAHIYDGTQQDKVITASLDGTDSRGTNGAWLTILSPEQIKAHIDWLVRGKESAIWPYIVVQIRTDASHRATAQSIASKLVTAGFTQAVVESSQSSPPSKTMVLDTGVEDPMAAPAITQLLKLPGNDIVRRPVQPNRAGWTPPAKINIIIGATQQPIASPTP